jgi:mono/diheme cytochrome c family protein
MGHRATDKQQFAVFIVALLLLGNARGQQAAAPPVAEDALARGAWHVLSDKCLACHGGDGKKFKSGLDLRTRQSALKGGERGPALVPGDPAQSLIYRAVTRFDEDLSMPPKEKDKLAAEQVELINKWIAAGAPWPEQTKLAVATTKPTTRGWANADADGVVVATSGGLSADWDRRKYKPQDLWAYQPVKRHAVPTDVIATAPTTNPVDAFVQNKLKQKGITRVAPAAGKVSLIRRLTFDLTGLPPTPQQVQAFVGDDSSDAYERLVERLLASPQYGEQMARHWLDVVRYADTSGFSNDFERPNAWRYRDYVIRSFNRDKPYDRFVVEQLAGDELDANDPEMLIAVGFLRMGPWEHTDMTVAAVTRHRFLDDVTQAVGVTFLGQSVRCASCHDHKFDPVPTRDYYRLQAVFGSTQFAERPAPFLSVENTKQGSDAKAAIERRLKDARAIAAEFQKKSQVAIAAFLKEKGVKTFDELPHEGRPNKGEFGLSKQEISLRKINRKRIDYLERERERYEPLAFSVHSGPTNNYSSVRPEGPQDGRPKKRPAESPPIVPVVHILTGGSVESPGEEVTPGVLSAVYGSNDRLAPTSWNTVPQSTSGRRLALAAWIASPNNTLTARVIVNRIWQQHFGKGLVATPNNFGKMGAKPSIPELLDYLTTWFVEHGWSVKKLHRLIVTSATYRQAGEHPDLDKLREIDAKNDLLAWFPPRRLGAEEIRDAMLAASTELNGEMGGPGMFPEINWEVAFQPRHVMGSVAPAYQPSRTPQERNRRTIYAFRYRTLSDPMLEVFNRPGSELSCERRDETTITPQAFSLFNSEFSHHRAIAMAASLRKDAAGLDEQIALAFWRVYSRAPTDDEAKKSAAHVAAMLEHHRHQKPQPTTLPQSVRRNMVEEMTGEDFHWDEQLDGLTDYQRDLMPWDVDAETRALAELCLVLLNSNEFLYVR